MVRTKSQANPGELPAGNSVPISQLSAIEAGSRGLERAVSPSKAVNGLGPDTIIRAPGHPPFQSTTVD
jgi:hypothetical protein